MAIEHISTGWEDDLKTRVYQTERIYIDFRQEIYPPFSGTLFKGDIIEGVRLGEVVLSERTKYILDGVYIGEAIAGTVTT